MRWLQVIILGLSVVFMCAAPSQAWAKNEVADALSKADNFVAQAIEEAQQGKLPDSKASYQHFHDT